MTSTCASVDRAAGLRRELSLLEQRFPERTLTLGDSAESAISYRTCGSGPAIVLLHGIGSGAASWLQCALRLGTEAQVIAWNAPGYGRSTALPQKAPSAADYAARLGQFLDALVLEECVLVGHSLGAITAAACVAAGGSRVSRLVLISPAQGYGSADKRERGREVAVERLGALERLGIDGMAEQRSARMLSPQASEDAQDWVRWNMRQLNPAGYAQAVHLLCGDDIGRYLQSMPPGVQGRVYCGAADAITTPQDSNALAARFGLPFGLIAGAGHACYIEQPDAVAAAIRQNL
jgi:pimeloyl-ACP methyl ester carboxylesterase